MSPDDTFVRRLGIAAVIALFCSLLTAAQGLGDLAVATAPAEGTVRFFGVADTSFQPTLDAIDEESAAWISDHYERMLVFAPYFHQHTAWYSRGWEYKDLYAIYNCEEFGPGGVFSSASECAGENLEMWQQAMKHPDWILRDEAGSPLYIPFDCEQGTCPQLAANLAAPGFQQLWITQAAEVLSEAPTYGGEYRGLFLDDVNLDFDRAVSDGDGCRRIDPQCDWDSAITRAEWAGLVAEFTERIRFELQTLFPQLELVHNSVWFHVAPGDLALGESLDRQIDAADVVNVERGINDPNLTATTLLNLLDYCDYVHQRERSVSHYIGVYRHWRNGPGNLRLEPMFATPYLPPLLQLEYGLAGWLLQSEGRDWLGSREATRPDDWWPGFEVDLGAALGERYQDRRTGLLRRDFERGVVLVNGPGTWPVTVTLPSSHLTLDGSAVTAVTLGSRVGRILLRASR